MSKIVRTTSDSPIDTAAMERLRRLADVPDAEIRADLIPERHFNLALAAARRKAGWKPGRVVQRRAS